MTSIGLAALLIIALTGLSSAQTDVKSKPAAPQSKPQTRSTKPTRPVETEDPALAQKRSVAIGSLRTLAIEARSYSDEALRARVQGRIVGSPGTELEFAL